MRFGIFHCKQVFFHEMMITSWWVMNTIADYGSTSIDQLMLGIGEVWYFSLKTGVFSRNDDYIVVGDEHHC